MCGIFGFISAKPEGLSSELLVKGTRAMAHRGPDDEGLIGWSAGGERLADNRLAGRNVRVALGHRRLSILDLNPRGRQPMTRQDGRWIVFNGEIYNYLELRAELSKAGYRFATETDTEVILAAYDAWGEDCLGRFNGMWAFAIYDPGRDVLFCSRDRMGVKPFYYARNGNGFFFSSEIAPLLNCPGISSRIDRKTLSDYLLDHRSDWSRHTFYEDVHELRGGCKLVLSGDSAPREERFWDLASTADIEEIGDGEALDRFQELFEDAVRLRLRSDVPVAISLSGGVDSSAVAIAASRMSRTPIHSFTSKFAGNPAIDETEFAASVAKNAGIDAHWVEPSLAGVLEEVPLLTKRQAMPYASLSLYVHWSILKEIRKQNIPVILSGQGGDEGFLGYERYYVLEILSRLPNPVAVLASFRADVRNSRLSGSDLLKYISYFSMPRLQRILRLKSASRIYRPEILADLHPPHRQIPRDLRDLQVDQIMGDQLGHLLRYDDRTSSAHGMETRLPFLDYRLVEFAFSLPLKHKIRDGWTKHLVRRYLERHGATVVAWRKNKLGFDAPQSDWTQSLVRGHGGKLQAHPFAETLLKPGIEIDRLPVQQQWDVFVCLQLAGQYDWK